MSIDVLLVSRVFCWCPLMFCWSQGCFVVVHLCVAGLKGVLLVSIDDLLVSMVFLLFSMVF